MTLRRQLTARGMEIPLYQAFRITGSPVLPPSQLTLALTYRCRNRCLTCKCWDKESGAELSDQDYYRFFEHLQFRPLVVTLTGGEPLERRDFVKIAALTAQMAKPAFMIVETAGDRPEDLFRHMRLLAERYPDTHFTAMLSLPGVHARLDILRGADRRGFETVLNTYRMLRGVGARNFSIGVNVVLSAFNTGDAAAVLNYAFLMYPDLVKLSVAHGSEELGVVSCDIAPKRKDHDVLLKQYLDRSRRVGGRSAVRVLAHVLRLQAQLAARGLHLMSQPIPCQAGHAAIYVSPSGIVRDCPVAAREMGDLRTAGFDLERILASEHARNVRKQVRTSGCFCPMEYADMAHALTSPGNYVRVLARSI